MWIEFDEANHEYKLDGMVVPSVTQVLKDVGFDSVASEWHMDRGTAVHKACEYYDQNDLDESKLDKKIKPYVQAWKKFLEENSVQIYCIEERVYNPTYMFAGTIDRLVKIKGQTYILDIKTGAPAPENRLQTAGYALCYQVDHKRMCVHLKENGRYDVRYHDDETDRGTFLACLTLRNWRLNQQGGSK